jgi:hypothetical protein
MDHIETFRRHADDCRSMARMASDPESRATWNQLAERWLRCAKNAQPSGDEERTRDPPQTTRRRVPRVVAIQKERRRGAH